MSFFEKLWQELRFIIVLVLLTPVMLAWRACEKIEAWQKDRKYQELYREKERMEEDR